MDTFTQLGLPDALTRTLAKNGITEPFPIQAASIPDALDGRDILGRAPTGSGKTLAFGLPLLARVEQATKHRPRALVLAPTRELAEQIKKELAPLAKAAQRRVLAIYGGVGYGGQKNALRNGVDVLVATPGRLEDLIEQKSVRLDQTDIVVVDEADRMADMGFLPAVRRILDATAADRQTLLFSATLDGDVAVLSREYLRDPVRHEGGAMASAAIDASHHFWLVQRHDRVQHTADIVSASGNSIVFTRTRHGADRLARQLSKLGVGAVAMHGGRNQNQRNRALKEFSTGRAQALIATDVAARGIHVDAVGSVVHFDPPADHKDYLHRSGRTARAGAGGTVVSLVSGDQRRTVRRMQQELNLDVPIEAPQLDALHNGDRRPAMAAAPKAERRTPRREKRPPRPVPAPGTNASAPSTSKTKSLYVQNLPWSATEEDVHDLFGRHGTVTDVTVITNRKTGRSRGFGFVTMDDADQALEALNGTPLEGRTLNIRPAHPKKPTRSPRSKNKGSREKTGRARR
ncbi:MAG: DEAD/DEAH box helicase [Acidimicrobiia bacterium]|nr:DEAD/DEAH box helicase [Acidimicrobiia bacterium]